MLNHPPVQPVTGTTTIAELIADHTLKAGDRVIAIGLYSKLHGIGKIAAIRGKLIAVKFASGHVSEFTEYQLRKAK
jgi:hypothetical protein